MRRFLSLGLMLVYLLGVRGGYVALWQDEDPEPVAVFPYAVASLPSEDQEALFRGIVIKNEEDLRYRLEDFLS